MYGKNFWAQIWAKRPKIQVFHHFLKFGSLVFLEIAYNDSLQQCIASDRGKTHEKKFFVTKIWAKMGQNQAPKQFFLPFSQVLIISF